MGSYIDNAPVTIGGAAGRVICASPRPLPAEAAMMQAATVSVYDDRVTEGRDENGAFIRFETRDGDVSQNERNAYGDKPAPKRSMIALESLGNVDRRGQRLIMKTGLLIEPGAPLVPNLFTVLAQWNAGPAKGQGWRPPIAELGLVAIPRPRSHDVDEFLSFKAHVWDAAAGKAVDAGTILSKRPIPRGLSHREVALAFVNGCGGDGRLEFYLNGEPQGAIYTGPTGYADFGNPFPAFGVYQHVGQKPLAARFYGWREAIKAAA